MDRYALVMLGGAIGSLARYVAATAITSRFESRFPLGTFLVNVSGCFAIGVLMTVLVLRGAHQNWRLLLVVGVLGGYTTFSSFGYETFVAARESIRIAALNAIASVIFGYFAVWLGVAACTAVIGKN
jgi:CrcB protein